MADSDKDIVITPNTGAASDPSIVFSSGATGGDDVTLNVTDDGTITTLSIEGSAGQLLAITNDLTGTIFAVNDVSGIPSIEVDADGTIRLAEFDGDVGIGQGTPTHKLHITGPTTANTHTGIFVDSTGDAYVDLRADNTTGGAETNNPYIRFRQDQDAVETVLGHNNSADDALGNAVTNASSNAFLIHNRFATGTIELAVNGSLGVKVDDSNDLTYYGNITNSGGANANQGINAGYFGINSNSGSDGHGLSLYNGYVDGEPTYGMMFAQTATFGTYGNTSADWATYFTMNSTANRGWAFKVAAGSVVGSINNAGYANFPRYYIAGSTTDYIGAVTGQYGSIQTNGSTGGYGGVSMDGNFALMNSGSAHVGLYDDINDDWMILAYPLADVKLYHSGNQKLATTSTGVSVTGELVASTRLACTSTTEYFDTQVYNTTGITSSGEFKDHSGTVRDVGFNHVRSISQTSSTINPLDDTHAGSIILRTGSSTVSILMATGSTFPIGSMCTILNNGTGGTHTISANTTTMYVMDGSGSVSTPASFALAIGGCITVWRQNTTVYYVWGAGIP